MRLAFIFHKEFFQKYKINFGLMVNKTVLGRDSLSHHCINPMKSSSTRAVGHPYVDSRGVTTNLTRTNKGRTDGGKSCVHYRMSANSLVNNFPQHFYLTGIGQRFGNILKCKDDHIQKITESPFQMTLLFGRLAM